LLDLYKNGAEKVSALANIGAEWDSTGKCRHVSKLAKAGLIEHTTFCSKENHIGYQWATGRNPDDVCYHYPVDGTDEYRTAMKRIVKILSASDRAMGPSELARLAGYASESYTKNAVRKLHKQRFVRRLSKGNHSICMLTDKGRRVVERIIKPLVLCIHGDEKRVDTFQKTNPTEEHLTRAMEMYATGKSYAFQVLS
jgi:predicted transcriptional regulator